MRPDSIFLLVGFAIVVVVIVADALLLTGKIG